jgi:acyl-CoA thioester hydrolase
MHIIPVDRSVYRLTIPVMPDDIDELNHVNNVIYLRWVQDAAFAHWNTAASEDLKAKCKWVVLRHEIDYHMPALPGDIIEACTWIDHAEGPRQRRYVAILRNADQKILASATTFWCLLDAQSNRPRKISPEISQTLGLRL